MKQINEKKMFNKIKFYPNNFNLKSFKFSIEEENDINLIKNQTQLSENKTNSNNNINLNLNIQKIILFIISHKEYDKGNSFLNYISNLNNLKETFKLNYFIFDEFIKIINNNNFPSNNIIILYNETNEKIFENNIENLNKLFYQIFEIKNEYLITNLKIGLNYLFFDNYIINDKEFNILFIENSIISTKGFKNNINSQFNKNESYILIQDFNYLDTPIILLESGNALIKFNKKKK
jgi:hypothetical protein